MCTHKIADLLTSLIVFPFSEMSLPSPLSPSVAVEVKKKKLKKSAAPSKYDWKDELVEALIFEWEDLSILYDVSNSDYHLKRKLALEASFC